MPLPRVAVSRGLLTPHETGFTLRPASVSAISMRAGDTTPDSGQAAGSRLLDPQGKTPMKRWLAFPISLVALVVIPAGFSQTASVQPGPKQQPNIVLIFPDNLGWG